MAPQQELQHLIPSSSTQAYPVEEVGSPASDDSHVVLIQPENSSGTQKQSKGGKGNGKAQIEPRNCRHIEAILFFFGIGGMIVSIVMLLQHLLIPYY